MNPRYNSSLSPKQSGWSGFYLYNLDADAVGAVVIADRENFVYFNGKLEWNGYFSSNSDGGYNWFTVDGEWIGYLIHNGEKGFNLFNTDGKWVGFLA